jgi:DNA-directed RNA polymerase beta' subunit
MAAVHHTLLTGKQRRVKRVQFGLMDDETIRRTSVATIDGAVIYSRGAPAPGGVMDPRLGSTDRRMHCATCGNGIDRCAGHTGQIELPLACFNVGYLDHTRKILQCVCMACQRICWDPADPRVVSLVAGGTVGKARLNAVYKMCRGKKVCARCALQGVVAPRGIVERTGLTYKVGYFDGAFDDMGADEVEFYTQPLYPEVVRTVFQFIPAEEQVQLGFKTDFARPVDLIVTRLIVPPAIIRPAISASEGSRSRGQSDITVKLVEINKRSIEIRNHMRTHGWDRHNIPPEAVDRFNRLQYDVATLVVSNIRGTRPSTTRNGIPLKSITDGLKGKEGRFRGDLMGKRVDQSARSVISPDPTIDIDEVGVPRIIALRLTLSERVTVYNRAAMRSRVAVGSGKLDGAESLTMRDGKCVQLGYTADRAALDVIPGCIVERYLQDGDYVLFNRQPTLHRMSMMAHRVRIMTGSTFRLNLSCTTPYNADFDGDEMNMHVPQSQAAQSEAREIMAVPKQILAPQANKPCMGLVQDTLLGTYLLTSPDTFLDRGQVMQMIMQLKYPRETDLAAMMPPPTVLKPRRLWTGTQVFGLLFPKGLYMGHPVGGELPAMGKAEVRIDDGEIVHGQLGKRHVGTSAGGVIHLLYLDFDDRVTAQFMSEAQRLVNYWLMGGGFSIGIKDCCRPPAAKAAVDEYIELATRHVDQITRAAAEAGSVVEEAEVEEAIQDILTKVLGAAGSIIWDHVASSSLAKTIASGSKGNQINVSQISACVGQQCVEGQRIKPPEPAHRSLPIFAPTDLSSASRGFVRSPYVDGLQPHEYFYHAQGGREGLVDTAVKTARTGYIQRRLVKGMESMAVASDASVRAASGYVSEYVYGGDGWDAMWVEKQVCWAIEAGDRELQRRCCPAEYPAVCDARARVREAMLAGAIGSLVNFVHVPVGAARLLERCRTDAGPGNGDVGAELNPVDFARRTWEACRVNCAADGEGAAALELVLLYEWRAEVVADLSVAARSWLRAEAVRRTARARVAQGEMVGCIAAQSIGEPITQMTLNSVDWTTTMAIHWTGPTPPPAPHDAQVGGFIDALIAERPHQCQVQPDGKTIYLPLPPGSARALSPDQDGRMVWTELEAVTRHPPVNRDGSATLLRVTTESGRRVVVTKAKSLLVERDGQLVTVDGDSVKLGDRVPVVHELPAHGQTSLSLRTVFRETEVVFSSVMIEAQAAWIARRNWFATFRDRTMYSRGDVMRDAVRKRPDLLKPNKVVWPSGGSPLPDHIELDRDFGFFIGAYLAKGCVTEHQVYISSVDEFYRAAAQVFSDRCGINSHPTHAAHQQRNNGQGRSLWLDSKLLALLVSRTCGSSAGKRVPGFALGAPDIFVEGLLDGYISGNGCVSAKQIEMSAASRSMELRDGIALLLSRFGIASVFTETLVLIKCTAEDGSRTEERYGEMQPLYRFRVGREGTQRFAQRVSLSIPAKKARCDEIAQARESRDKRLRRFPLLGGVRLEGITGLEEVESSHESVYDLTVAETRNMTTCGGLGVADTFHLAGVRSMNVTRGLPRITELVDVARTIKMPVTTVYLAEGSPEEFVERVPGLKLTAVVARRRLERADQAPNPAAAAALTLYHTVFARDVATDNGRGADVVLVLDLDAPTMHIHGLVPTDVKRAIDRLYNCGAERLLEVVASDSSATEWWVRIRMLGEIVRMKARTPPEHAGQLEHHVVQRVGDYLVEATLVSGVTGVTAATIREITTRTADSTGAARDVKTMVVDAAGRALPAILTMPGVDVTRTTSNDVPEVHAVLGIEAAAQCLAEELAQTLGYDGRYINARHVTTVVNTMTCRGFLMQLSRHGINRVETGPLVRCSFEETIDTLFDAAIFGEFDNVVGVTPNVMLGQLCPVGTGTMDILEAGGPARPGRTTVVLSRYRAAVAPASTAVRPERERVVHSRMSYQRRVDDAAGVIRSLAMCTPTDNGRPSKRAKTDAAAMVDTTTMDLPFMSADNQLAAYDTFLPLGDGLPAPESIVVPHMAATPCFIQGHETMTAMLR